MNTGIKQELYVSPEVEVMEVKARQMLCQSAGIGDMGVGDNIGNDSFI